MAVLASRMPSTHTTAAILFSNAAARGASIPPRLSPSRVIRSLSISWPCSAKT